jgi:hypothetical protein
MAYNPYWLQNMYMGKYETEEERSKRLQDESINNVAFGNSGVGTGFSGLTSLRSQGLMQDAIDQGEFTGGTTPKPTDTKGSAPSGKLGTADYVGLGLQLAGAMQADKEAGRLEKKEDEKYSKEMQRLSRQREDELRRAQEQMQRQDRGMNMQGLEMLAQQRERAYSKRVSDSMANTFARAMRG